MLLLPLLPLLLLLLSGACIYLLPTAFIPTSILSNVSFAMLSSQLIQSLPLVQSLTADSASSLTMISYATMLLAFCCTPSSLLRLYADAVSAAGPLLGVCSAAVWVEAVTRGSRIVSRAIGEAEREEENANSLKALVIGFCAVCYLLSARWLYLCIRLLAWSSLMDGLLLLLLLSVCGYLTFRSLSLPRAVLSESAVVLMLVSLSCYRFLRSRLPRAQRHEWKDAHAETWLLESIVPLALDALSLMLLGLVVQARMQAAQDKQERHNNRSSSSAASASPSLNRALYRSGAIVLLTHLLQAHLSSGDGSHWIASYLPSALATPSWLNHASQWVVQRAPSLWASATADPESTASTLTAAVAAASTAFSHLLPRGTGPISRALAAIACSAYRLHPTDDEHED